MQPTPWCAPLRCGIVTGLRAEARIAAPLGTTATGGGTPAGATAAAERLVAAGATALLSFGLCGGLDPSLAAGDLVVPARVRAAPPLAAPDGWSTDATLFARLRGTTASTLYAGSAVIAEVAQKQALFIASAAAAVDLESGAIATVATRHGLPFAVLRAVCDPATLSLPAAALLALDPHGGIQPWQVAVSVLRAPAQLPDLFTLARAAAAARRALVRRVAQIVDGGGR